MNSELKTRWLHIPMEILDRELYPKLFLASEAVRQGWQCVLGSKKSVLDAAAQLPPGVVYLKSVIPSELENMRTYKKAGHRLVCLDEEGLVQSSLETLVTARYCPETVAEAEKFFCWGDIQREALQKYYIADAEKFSSTGSPTADLWSLKAQEVFKDEVKALKERFGKFILIPSSFGVPNHFMGPEEALKIMVRDNMFRDQADYDYYKGYHDYTARLFEDFLKLLPGIAQEFSDYTILVRPHPAENHATWKKAVEGLKNVTVLFEGPISPWLLGADVIFHWGSTTGIEAYMMGRPVVGYSPEPESEKVYEALPHLVSIMTQTEAEAIATLRDVLNKPKDWLSRYPAVMRGHEILKSWIYNIEHGPAIDNIMRALEAMNVEAQSFNGKVKTDIQNLTIKELIWRILDVVGGHELIHKFFPERIQLGLKSRAYGRRKVKEIDPANVRKALHQLAPVPAKAEEIGKNLFWIRQ